MDANLMEETFTSIYQNCSWGDNKSSGYKGSSGTGSEKDYNAEYVGFIKDFLVSKDIKSVVEVGCGDWRLGEMLFLETSIQYVGYDVYSDLVDHLNVKYGNENIRFLKMDSSSERNRIKNADLLICKDVLQHWDDESVSDFLDWIVCSKKFKYALVTNCRSVFGSSQGTIGGWRGLDMDHPLIAGRGFSTVMRYNTKDVLLYQT